jgi:transposase-like protein
MSAFVDYVITLITCPLCGKSEPVVQNKNLVSDDPVKIGYVCPHCGWPKSTIAMRSNP